MWELYTYFIILNSESLSAVHLQIREYEWSLITKLWWNLEQILVNISFVALESIIIQGCPELHW